MRRSMYFSKDRMEASGFGAYLDLAWRRSKSNGLDVGRLTGSGQGLIKCLRHGSAVDHLIPHLPEMRSAPYRICSDVPRPKEDVWAEASFPCSEWNWWLGC
jgi:hypothetical protein